MKKTAKHKADEEAEEKKRRNAAASKIQSLFRKRKSRKYVLILLQSIYQRVWDDDNKRYYYYNKNTGKSSWNKPKMLKDKDIQLSPRSKKEEENRLYAQWKKEKDYVPPKVAIVVEDKMGPPPRVKAKAWTKRAAVYWLHPPVDKAPKPITGYKVKRWRLDKQEWKDKGVEYSPAALNDRESRKVFNDLSDLISYKFEIIPYWTDEYNRETDGASTTSNIVTPKPVLPEGWEAIFDENELKIYYHNTITKETVWNQPLIGPWTLPTKLEAHFSKEDIQVHKANFLKYDLDESGALDLDELEALIRELSDGIKMPRGQVIKLMDSIDQDCSGQIEFHEYVQLMLDIKRGTAPNVFEKLNSFTNTTKQITGWMAKELITEWRESLAIREEVVKADEEVLNILRTDTGALGDWIQEYSLGDIYYYNKITGATEYVVPEDVRYYVPHKMKRLFTAKEITLYRKMFDDYDEDGSGTIGPTELKGMYDKLGESFSKERLREILEKIDVNNDGELDFREFVGMILMFKLSNPRLTAKSIGRAAVHMVTKLFSSPSVIKESIGETLEGTKFVIEGSSVYKTIAGDEEHVPLLTSINNEIKGFFSSLQGNIEEKKKQNELDRKRKAILEKEKAEARKEAKNVTTVIKVKGPNSETQDKT